MADNRNFIKIFIASPSDLVDERKITRAVADNLNHQLGGVFGCHIDLVGWEDTLPGSGRPQAIINQDLDRCDYFIGLLWKRWGTPPDNGGEYTSGFEEEFRRSCGRLLAGDRPEIFMFFKSVPDEQLRDPGEQLRRVVAFKNELIATKQHLFKEFVDERDFESKIRDLLTSILVRSERQEQAIGLAQTTPMLGEDSSQEEVSQPHAKRTPLSPEGVSFLRRFVSETERSGYQDAEHSVEIARFRLLASLLRSHQNDSNNLGPHDANIIYRNALSLDLGWSEMRGLLRTGLENLSSENVPLWHWFSRLDSSGEYDLVWGSLFGSPNEKAGALKLLRLLSRPLGGILPRETLLESWFAEDSPNVVVTSAIEYLADHGIAEDIPVLQREFDKNRSFSATAAADAVIRISLREGLDMAVAALLELRPSALASATVEEIFRKNGRRIDTTVLSAALLQPSASVRRAAFDILVERGELTEAEADSLLSDDDFDIRSDALKVLLDFGRIFSEDDIKRIVAIPSQSKRSNFHFLAKSDRGLEAQMNVLRLDRLTNSELRALVRNGNQLFEMDAYFLLAGREFKRFSPELRSIVDDNAASFFEEKVGEMKGRLSDAMLARLRGLEESFRKDLTRGALTVLCERFDPVDLTRVRKAIAGGFVSRDEPEVFYLGRVGERKDIQLLIEVSTSAENVGSLLIGATRPAQKVIAKAMLSISKANPAYVLKSDMPIRLRTEVVSLLAPGAFVSMPEGLLLDLLSSTSDQLRRLAAMKCAIGLAKKEATGLLGRYLNSDGSKYYNVIHWLDLAASMPRKFAISAARMAIS